MFIGWVGVITGLVIEAIYRNGIGTFIGAILAFLTSIVAHNLARWVSRLGLGETLVTTKTLRHRHLAVPGRLAFSGRCIDLHLPAHWPWAEPFLSALQRLRTLPMATPA